MILIDTSVWVDHLRRDDRHVAELLDANMVLMHPWVYGEILLGGVDPRSEVAALMPLLPQATVATDVEVRALMQNERLSGSGIGYVDAQLLASCRLTSDARLWTRDARLNKVAQQLKIAYRAGSGRR